MTFVKPQPGTDEKGNQTYRRMLTADSPATRLALRVGPSVFDLRLRRGCQRAEPAGGEPFASSLGRACGGRDAGIHM